MMKTVVTLEVLAFFFFQAEDGIRDWSVTGVQTCALPIFPHFTTAFLRNRSAFVARDGRAASRDIALMLQAIVEANELPEDDDVLTALPSRLPDRYVLAPGGARAGAQLGLDAVEYFVGRPAFRVVRADARGPASDLLAPCVREFLDRLLRSDRVDDDATLLLGELRCKLDHLVHRRHGCEACPCRA